MFKAARDGTLKVITANRLDDGLVVFLNASDGWTLDITEARLIEDDDTLAETLAWGHAQHEARVIVDAYAIDVEFDGATPVPARLRERIRAERGPTIPYGAAERARLAVRAAGETGA